MRLGRANKKLKVSEKSSKRLCLRDRFFLLTLLCLRGVSGRFGYFGFEKKHEIKKVVYLKNIQYAAGRGKLHRNYSVIIRFGN